MLNKPYRKLEKVVDSYIFDVREYFLHINQNFKKQAEETKSRSHGGYEVVRYAEQFGCEISYKRIELLEKIEFLFTKVGRKLSSEQHKNLIEKCTKLFDGVITDYQELIEEEFGHIESIKLRLQSLRSNNAVQIKSYIEALEILSSTKVDTALFWTAVGVIVSAALSLASIIIDIFKP